MDSRQLETFAAVAQELSFTRGAARLHTAQSAVSATVARLEREVGVALFDRSTRTTRLTPAGQALLPRALAVADALRAARDAVDAAAGTVTGRLSLGYMSAIALTDLPGLLGRFTQAYPSVTLSLRTGLRGTQDLADAVRSGDLDVAFLGLAPQDAPDLDVVVLRREPFGLTVPVDHPLAGREAVTLRELTQEPFVDFPEGFGNRRLVDDLFRDAGLRRQVRSEATDIGIGIELVAAGLGIAFLPDYLVTERTDVRRVAVRGVDLRLPIAIAADRTRRPSAAVEAMWRLATASVPGAVERP